MGAGCANVGTCEHMEGTCANVGGGCVNEIVGTWGWVCKCRGYMSVGVGV